ncbi:TPA: phage tail spike protein, partial [Streptococcus pyogenes]|nr:phage tail protein [Streptococcus pyogenes]HEP2125040.1 phage tail protein [Streptococcus pyogenes]HEP2192660.1 phage tail protein [Streptococcus pyogenes]HEP2264655.1 phage tail protein [Streptococcus pyogenes]HEP2329344.1 phage tail protein [Streptococcus pyogenes]
MIPVLYEAKETKFRTFGLGEIADAYEVKATRERNGNYSLYIKYPLDGVFASVFKEEMKIKSDAGRRTKWQTFEINRVLRNSKDHIEIFARHISMRTQDIALKPFVNGASVGAESALEIWKKNLVGDDKFDVKSDILTLGSFNWEIDKIGNARGALGGVAGSILDVYGGEYEFDNRTIILRKQMGRKAPTVLEYGRNIVSVEEERLLDGNYTSIYPYVRYTPQPKPQEETPGKPHVGEHKQPEEQLVTLPEFILDG